MGGSHMRTLTGMSRAYDKADAICLQGFDKIAWAIFFVQIIIYGIVRAVLLPSLILTFAALTAWGML